MSESAQMAAGSDEKAEPRGDEMASATSVVDEDDGSTATSIDRERGDLATDTSSPPCDTRGKAETATGLDDVPLTFPQRLFEILRDKQSEGVIEWLPHGLGWTVRDKKRFASEVLPKHFAKQSKFTSFTRKLNRWNFTRVTRGPEIGAYYHPLFRRDDPNLCLRMTCINPKSPQQLQPLDPVALGLGVVTVALLPPPLPAVGSPGVSSDTVQPPTEGAPTDPGERPDSDGGEDLSKDGKSNVPAPPPPAGASAIADSLDSFGSQANLLASTLAYHTNASSDPDSSLTQPTPKVSPFQSTPLCLPPKPRKTARKGPGTKKADAPQAT